MIPFSGRLLAAAVLSGAVAVAGAGCGKNSANAGGAGPTFTPPARTPTPAATTPSATGTPAGPVCKTSGLRATVATGQGGAAAGSAYVPIDFTNISGAACTMFGYPGLSFVASQGGAQIGRPATRQPATPPATDVSLAPGGVGHTTLRLTDAGNFTPSVCKPVTAKWLRIYPPGQRAALIIPYTAQVCSAKVPHKFGEALGVFVMRPGPGKQGENP